MTFISFENEDAKAGLVIAAVTFVPVLDTARPLIPS